MSKKLGQEPAFPLLSQRDQEFYYDHQIGMSKRFYAAVHILSGFAADPSCNHFIEREYHSIEREVEYAYKLADELLKQENE